MNAKIIIALAAIALPGTAFASSPSSSATGSATAQVVGPITLTHTSGAALNFGKFTVGTGGTVAVSSVGTGTLGGNVLFVPGSTTAADSFSVAGDPSRSFSIATTGGNITAGTNTIAFTTSPSAAGATTDTSGAASFTVGGTLTLVGTEGAGTYTGSYNATVTYN